MHHGHNSCLVYNIQLLLHRVQIKVEYVVALKRYPVEQFYSTYTNSMCGNSGFHLLGEMGGGGHLLAHMGGK
ncbi:hypothetical protein HanRHA438_Chr15g0705511 [Helianthus annuus]|nr:hypothetical protein HanRHA438_Chr15g0705511 [Helianthus annuus]